jgi:ArsR family transcriptional regulator, arsenate/arsenite/antimonite-responsive transcriptional repressor / arsenate reductase (thioredoxin)
MSVDLDTGAMSNRPIQAARHAALGDEQRLAIVEGLLDNDRSPTELGELLGIPSNLLAHHLDVLEACSLVVRQTSAADKRRRYVSLNRTALSELAVVTTTRPIPSTALFVCTHNAARSQLAAAVWTELTRQPAYSAGTEPTALVHPLTIAAASDAGLDMNPSIPRSLAALTQELGELPPLIVSVCDRAHEEETRMGWLHWSIPDPSIQNDLAAFAHTITELRRRTRHYLRMAPV